MIKEMLFETVQGYRLIGIPVTPPREFIEQLNSTMDFSGGFWLHRTRLNRPTYLSHDEIKSSRLVNVFDTEFDPPLGIY